MRILILNFILFLILAACSDNNKQILPYINLAEFPGFKIFESTNFQNTQLIGYEYQSTDDKIVSFKTCPDVENANESSIAEFELFRFRLLVTSCQALKKYYQGNSSKKSYFDNQFTAHLVQTFPASSVPLLSKEHQSKRQNKALIEYDNKTYLTMEQNGSVKLLTEEDELYYSLVARADFTGDQIEDLLVRTEWFARKASGKHVDLLVLSKTGKDQPSTISWRMMKI